MVPEPSEKTLPTLQTDSLLFVDPADFYRRLFGDELPEWKFSSGQRRAMASSRRLYLYSLLDRTHDRVEAAACRTRTVA